MYVKLKCTCERHIRQTRLTLAPPIQLVSLSILTSLCKAKFVVNIPNHVSKFSKAMKFQNQLRKLLRPVLYVEFRSRRMQFKQ
jgi:hypothetical protein